MKLSKFDIGAEILSILTKGMYPDPKDALREYIQNGVDAQSKNMSVKIRQESIVVEDDGIGMDFETLRKAIRIGISDKSPTRNVGFMGIGIYSSFHLCDKLMIFSRGGKDIPNKLEMDFGKMKLILDSQKDKRLKGEIKSEDLIDLQTILEECVTLTNDGELEDAFYPTKGTRVELSKIEPEFYTALSSFDEVSEYLRNVIPLKFNEKEFKYAKQIEDEISRICTEKNQKFELVNLTLQVNSKIEQLFRPYRDIDFSKDSPSLKPIFHNIESEDIFFGVAWGCLNSQRKKLDNKNLRGFILKKQGFSIGNRESLIKFFPRGNTFFDRYSGEVIIVNAKLLPNASRNDIEYSPLRSVFYESLTEVADRYDDFGHNYQETTRADEDLAEIYKTVKVQLGSYSEFELDTEVLVSKIVILKNVYDKLNNKLKGKKFSEESEGKGKALLEQVQQFENTIQGRIKHLTDKKKKKQEEDFSSKIDLAKSVANIKVDKVSEVKKYETLLELLNDLEYKIDDEFKEAIHSIDELFVQRTAKTKAEYYELLNILKERIQNNN